MKSVPPDVPLLRKLPVDRVGRRGGGRSWKNAVSKTATCGTSGSNLRATSMPSIAGGLCSGASIDSLLELGDDRVIDDRGR